MTMCEQENAVFEKWQKVRRPFARDGVMFEEEYVKSNPKIAIILKEVNSENDPDPMPLTDYLNKTGGGGKLWHNVARWVYGIRNRHALPSWLEFQDKVDDSHERVELFKSICVINLKKSPGGSSVGKSFRSIVLSDAEYIREQYGIYKPDLTLCGGTADLFKEVMQHNKMEQKWRRTSRGAEWYEREPKKFVLHLYHPAIRAAVRNPLVFYEMMDMVNEIYGD